MPTFKIAPFFNNSEDSGGGQHWAALGRERAPVRKCVKFIFAIMPSPAQPAPLAISLHTVLMWTLNFTAEAECIV